MYTDYRASRGNLHVITLKKKFNIRQGTITQEIKPPEILQKPDEQNHRLIEECELYPKKEFTDVILRAHVYPPGYQSVSVLDAGIEISKRQCGIRVFGQRNIKIEGGRVSFSSPEPFQKVPLTWEEAYGGHDLHNEDTGDVWDLKNFSESFNKDLHFLNFNRYRRNPLGKGYLMKLKPEHHGTPLPRVEMAHDLLTPERLQSPHYLDWHFQPIPACFDWRHYNWFPRTAFLAEKLLGKMNELVPQKPLPEYVYGYSRQDLFGRLPAHELIMHPRMFNAAHPALQIPNKKRDLEVTLWHMDPEISQFKFRIPYKQPQIYLNVPGEKKTYKDKGILSNVIIDMNDKTLTTCWHCRIRTFYPISDENKEKISHRVDW
ncbi:MAG: hypothetical protein CR997_10265 [Acidobacteria bacterium]|nr:MAG: hypothetical protein CR997_10265 [Acidobacteriota bacterium]